MPVISARLAFHELIRTDAPMVAILGGERIRYGWIRDQTVAANFPQITYHATSDDRLGTDPRTGDEHFDATMMALLWAWPGNEAQGRGIIKVEEMDHRLLFLCNDKYRAFQGVRIHYRVGSVRDYPDEPDAPVRIGRPIIMGIR